MKTHSQKPKNLLIAAFAGLILNFISFAMPAFAQTATWSPWQSLGDNISVSFSQVAGGSTWTWKFRNDGTQTITFMDFNYTDSTGQHYDSLPGSLTPGQVIGGWAAYTATSLPSSIQLKTVKFADSGGGQTNSTTQSQQNGSSTSGTSGQQSSSSTPTSSSQQTPPAPQLSAQQQRLIQSAQQNLANAQADMAAGAAFQAELNDYGKWMTLNGASYWQPTEATSDPDWRPYSTGGHWVATDLGWTWQSDYNWGWAAFHYGRWADDPVLGWIWQPGSVWAPAWVAWRNNDAYCGWAPLPPGIGYDMNLGFTFNGVAVSADFDFGLGADDYCFVAVTDMDRPSYRDCLLAHDRVPAVYKQTVIIKESYKVHDGHIVNTGIPFDRFHKITGRDIQPIKVSLGPERNASKGPIDGRLALRQVSFNTGEKPRAEIKAVAREHEEHSVLDDLLKDDTHATPRPAQAKRSDSVIDDLLSEDRSKRSSETRHNSAADSGRSDDVVGRLLARGHDEPVRPPAVQSRPVVSRQDGNGENASRPTYQRPEREQSYQAPQQNYQAPQQTYQQQDNRQEQRNNQQADQQREQERQQQEQQRQQQAEEERQQQEQQRQQQEQERQQQQEQQRQQQEQQREQERQQQEEQQRQQQEQERQQQEQLREQERQQQEQQRQQQEQERQQREQERQQQRRNSLY